MEDQKKTDNTNKEYVWDFFATKKELTEERRAESRRRLGSIIAFAVGCAVVIISFVLIAIAL